MTMFLSQADFIEYGQHEVEIPEIILPHFTVWRAGDSKRI